MKEIDFNEVKKNVLYFKQELISNINKNIENYSSFSGEECYIIEKIGYNKLEEYFNQYENIEEHNNFANNELPKIIDNFPSLIDFINNNNKFEIFSKSLLEYLYSKNDLNNLKDYNYAKYYAGNNKLIIEFQGKDEDKAILLIDPLDKDDIKKNSFIIIINYKEEKLWQYKNLINLKNINEISEYINDNNNVIPLEKYNNSNNNIFKRDILKILTYIFYYEKPSYNKDNIFNEYYQYYLINLEWLKAFKDFYNYEKLYLL